MKQVLMNKSKSLVTCYLLFLMSILCISLNSCKEDNTTVKVSAVTVKEAKYTNGIMQISLKDNETLQLTPYILPQNATSKTVVFSNKHPELIEISGSGLITAKSAGIDTLTLRTTDGSGVKVSYKVNITNH